MLGVERRNDDARGALALASTTGAGVRASRAPISTPLSASAAAAEDQRHGIFLALLCAHIDVAGRIAIQAAFADGIDLSQRVPTLESLARLSSTRARNDEHRRAGLGPRGGRARGGAAGGEAALARPPEAMFEPPRTWVCIEGPSCDCSEISHHPQSRSSPRAPRAPRPARLGSASWSNRLIFHF